MQHEDFERQQQHEAFEISDAMEPSADSNSSSTGRRRHRRLFCLATVAVFVSYKVFVSGEKTTQTPVEDISIKTKDLYGNTDTDSYYQNANESTFQRDYNTTDDSPFQVHAANISWSNFSKITQFTHHVLEVIGHWSTTYSRFTKKNEKSYVKGDTSKCDCQVTIVPRTYANATTTKSAPNDVICSPNCSQKHRMMDCNLMTRIFTTQRRYQIPYNATFGFHYGDYDDKISSQTCFVNSSPGGFYGIPNMEDRAWMNKKAHYLTDTKKDPYRPDLYRWPYPVDIPWENRSSIPIFRGSGWSNAKAMALCAQQGGNKPSETFRDQFFELMPKRWKAVDISVQHPHMLDARLSSVNAKSDDSRSCMEKNATNGLVEVLTVDRIEPNGYFSRNQVALVLKGIGAAFRLSNHFMTTTAVILQQVPIQEWYTKYLIPFHHFIPVDQELDTLETVLEWIQKNPIQVHEIAQNGRLFWETHLSFPRHEEHFYELAYRLSEYQYLRSIHRAPALNDPSQNRR